MKSEAEVFVAITSLSYNPREHEEGTSGWKEGGPIKEGLIKVDAS